MAHFGPRLLTVESDVQDGETKAICVVVGTKEPHVPFGKAVDLPEDVGSILLFGAHSVFQCIAEVVEAISLTHRAVGRGPLAISDRQRRRREYGLIQTRSCTSQENPRQECKMLG